MGTLTLERLSIRVPASSSSLLLPLPPSSLPSPCHLARVLAPGMPCVRADSLINSRLCRRLRGLAGHALAPAPTPPSPRSVCDCSIVCPCGFHRGSGETSPVGRWGCWCQAALGFCVSCVFVVCILGYELCFCMCVLSALVACALWLCVCVCDSSQPHRPLCPTWHFWGFRSVPLAYPC